MKICGCHLDPSTDNTPGIDLCSEATGTFNGQAWIIVHCPLHAAAPELLKALRELVLRCDGAEGVRADGSNIQTMRAHALLRELDEKEE